MFGVKLNVGLELLLPLPLPPTPLVARPEDGADRPVIDAAPTALLSGNFCGQMAANLLAKRMPRQCVGVTGGMNRREPVGGVA